MKKSFLFLMILAVFSCAVNAQDPTIIVPFKQTDWSGGDGQVLYGDPIKFYQSTNINYNLGNIILDAPEDTAFSIITSYPPSTATVTKVNGFRKSGDTVFVYSGKEANVAYSITYGATWNQYDTLPMNQIESEILDLEYIDGVTYACGYYGGFMVGYIFKSLDKKTWQTNLEQPVGVSKVFDLLQVKGDTFLMATGDDVAPDMDGVVYRSFDGCSTWSEVDTIGQAITKLVKASDDTIFACGDNADTLYWTYLQCVRISTDGGDTWAPSGIIDPVIDSLLLEGEFTVMISMEYINNYLYVGSWVGDLYRSGDYGATWEKLDTLNAILDTSEVTGIFLGEGDSVLFITTSSPGALYKSYDGGLTLEIADIICDKRASGFVKLGPNTIGVGSETWETGDNGRICYASFYRNANLISSAVDIDENDSVNVSDFYNLYKMKAKITNPKFTSYKMKIRSASDSLMSDAMDWLSCPYYTMTASAGIFSGKALSEVTSITAGQKYLQYMIELTSSGLEATPVVDSIWIEKFTSTGISSPGTVSISNRVNVEKLSQVKYLVTSDLTVGEVRVYDLAGRMITKNTISNGKATLILDVPDGKYSIKVYANDKLMGGKQITVLR